MNKRALLITILLFITYSVQLLAQPQKKNVHKGIPFIVNKFDQYNIVAIGETHDKVEVTDFYIDLVKNDEFRKKVDFLVIEMGNHLYQNILDDYISGKTIDEKEIFKLWRNHTSCMLNESDNTGMIRLLKSIRDTNLNSEYKIRVLAGDPPVDWNKITCLQQFYKFLGTRNEFYTGIVKDYILNSRKKGLIIMGNSHFNKQRTKYMIEKDLQNPITTLINSNNSSLYLLNVMTSSSFPYDNLKELELKYVITTNDPWLGGLKIGSPFIKDKTLKTQTDGIIYLGKKSTLTLEEIKDFEDINYERELKRRNNLPKCN